jgi:hypothetical protein
MSSVPEVLAAIAALGTATLPNSQVINGSLTSVTGTQGRLFLIGDEEFEVQREPDSLGGTTATESYTVPCAIAADIQTPDQYVADAQAWADYEAVEAAIRAAPQLGLAASFSLNASVTVPRFRRLADENGRHALVRFGVEVFAASN